MSAIPVTLKIPDRATSVARARVDDRRVPMRRDAVTVKPVSELDIAHYVCRTPEVARAIQVLTHSYGRLAGFVTPLCVLAEIALELDGLERWLEKDVAHLDATRRPLA